MSQNLATTAAMVNAPDAMPQSAYSQHQFVNRHNYGYVLKCGQDVHIATYHAKLIFHLELPDWQVEFQGLDHHCAWDRNWSLPCLQLREILDAVRNVRSYIQFIQHEVRRIHEVVADLPTITRRSCRGFLTDVISHITGLATKDQVHAVIYILEQIEKSIYESARLCGDGARSLTAAFKLEQSHMGNVFGILKQYRKTIRGIQYEFMHSRAESRQVHRWSTLFIYLFYNKSKRAHRPLTLQ